MLPVLRLYLLAFFGSRAAIYECVGDLPVQLGPICNDYEGPIARLGTQDLLGEIEHRKTFARTLRVPENPELAARLADLVYGRHDPIHPEELVVLGELL